MEFAYRDIIGLQRPAHLDDLFSRRHPRMTRLNRAKLFAPFAALSGFETAIRAKETPYVARRVPDEERTGELNRALIALRQATCRGGTAPVPARIEYFEVCADPNHEAFGRLGLYREVVVQVRGVDPARGVVIHERGETPFSDLFAITEPSGEPLSLPRVP